MAHRLNVNAPRRALSALLGVAAFAGASLTRAEGERPGFVAHDPGAEAAFAAAIGATHGAHLLPQRDTGWAPSHAGPLRPGADQVSDVFGTVTGSLLQLGVGYVFEASYLATARDEDPGVSALHQSMVEIEAFTLATGVTALLKRLTGRCRPFAQTSTGCHASDAFPSGHTSSTASFAGARLYRLAATPAGEGLPLRAASFAWAETATVAVAVLRTQANKHSWEDVVVGGLVGHAAGLLVAAAHPSVPIGAETTLPAPLPAPVMFTFGGAF